MGDRPRPALKLALDEPRLHTPEGNHGELTNDIPCRSTNKEQRKNFTHLHYEGEHLARWPRSSLLQHSVPSSSSRSSKIIWVAQSDMWPIGNSQFFECVAKQRKHSTTTGPIHTI